MLNMDSTKLSRYCHPQMQLKQEAAKRMSNNPAWRTYKYAGQKKEKKIADDETVKKLIQALEAVSILYETYFKLIIATGMRRGELCAQVGGRQLRRTQHPRLPECRQNNR